MMLEIKIVWIVIFKVNVVDFMFVIFLFLLFNYVIFMFLIDFMDEKINLM